MITASGYIVLTRRSGPLGNRIEVSARATTTLTLVSGPADKTRAWRVETPEQVQLVADDEATHWTIYLDGQAELEGDLNNGAGARRDETIQIVFGPSIQ